MRHVTVRQLQVFVEAAERLSLARVAERLRLTPAAVSFQIKQIEQISGVALFERIGRRITLTDAGMLLLGYARHVLRSLHDADQALLALQGGERGRARLGLVSTAKYIVPHIIARFRVAHPGIEVVLREGNRREVADMLAAGAIDLAVAGAPSAQADVIGERFADHPSIIVAPPAHPLTAETRLEGGMLAGEPFIIREDGSGTRALADDFFREAGFVPRVALESRSNETIKQAVTAGMGLALISQHTVRLELALGLLAPLRVRGLPRMRAWHVVRRRGLPLLPAQDRLRGFIVARGQAIIDGLGRDYDSFAPHAPARAGAGGASSGRTRRRAHEAPHTSARSARSAAGSSTGGAQV